MDNVVCEHMASISLGTEAVSRLFVREAFFIP